MQILLKIPRPSGTPFEKKGDEARRLWDGNIFLVNLQLTVIMIKRKSDHPPCHCEQSEAKRGIREGYTGT
jgi:hypothetical protein